MKQEMKTWWVESPWSGVALFLLVAIVFAVFNHQEWIIIHRQFFLLGLVVFTVVFGAVCYQKTKKQTAEEVVEKYIVVANADEDEEYDIGEVKQNIFSLVVIVVLSLLLLVILVLIGVSSYRINKLEEEKQSRSPDQGRVQEKPLVPEGFGKTQKDFVKKGMKL